MEAAEFIKERNRMCGYYNSMSEGCYVCPAFNAAYRRDCEIATDNPEHLVAIVEKWTKEHPDKQEQGQQKLDQGTIGYLDPTAFKEYYASYQSVKDLRVFCVKLADRVAALEKYPVEFMRKPKCTNKDALLAAFPNAEVGVDGVPKCCPKRVEAEYAHCRVDCKNCLTEYWLAEAKE